MIEILQIINKKREIIDYKYADCLFQLPSNLDNLKKYIEILTLSDEQSFGIAMDENINLKDLTKLLNIEFSGLVKYKNNYVDYEMVLIDFSTGTELFDAISKDIIIEKKRNSSLIRIDIPDDLFVDSPKWKKFSPKYIYNHLIKLGETNTKNLFIERGGDTGPAVRILFHFELTENINNAIKKVISILPIIEDDLQKQINSEIWTDEFYSNEKLFSTELILPLLRRMEYINVRYNHGIKEYGRDFLFAEINKFSEIVNFGMQIKAGNISGEVNSEIDMIIGQINDAFTMPFNKLGHENDYHITTFIVAISGHFTDNAKEKIKYKINKGLYGSIYFWDKDKIMELIEKYWNRY